MGRAIGIVIAYAAMEAALAAPPSDELALTRRLSEAGAPQLVLDRVSRLQPGERNAAQWSEWEALRCSALASLARNAELAERVGALPRDARTEPLAPCFTGAARAALAIERYGDARAYAAYALWQFKLAPADVQALRRVVIEAYVGERRGDDAYRAMLRYQQDHSPLPREVPGRFVDALLDLRMEKEALTWLTQLDDSQPAKLRLRLRAGLVPRDMAIAQARTALAKAGSADYWNVILDAAGDADGLPLRLAAYEQRLNRRDGEMDGPGGARRLWDAYIAAAIGIANKSGLLVGDDTNWADFAGRRMATEPVVARAFFAHLAQHGQAAATRQNAQLQLLYAYQTEKLEVVALRVFEAIFSDVDALDTQVRYRLGAMAEARQQAAAAVRYWKDLPPPPDVEAGEWLLRLSRQRWRAEGGEPGIDAFTRYFAVQTNVPASVVQQAIAYAEELAERGQHAAAERLLEALMPRAQPAQSRAALLAVARARESAGEFARAAEGYLRAALLGQGALDTAAVQARLRAGVALARAGYLRDARTQLEWVMNNTKDAALLEAARNELKRLQP
ncbi:MAG: hypothetical protein ACM3SS_14490 [Rhodospirillaceae bacterium]